MEAALERTGDMVISLSLQETMRGVIEKDGISDASSKYVAPYNSYVTIHEGFLK